MQIKADGYPQTKVHICHLCDLRAVTQLARVIEFVLHSSTIRSFMGPETALGVYCTAKGKP